MKTLFTTFFVLALATLSTADQLLIIQGAPGEDAYAERFQATTQTWLDLADDASIPVTQVTTTSDEISPKQRIQNFLSTLQLNATDTLWIVYIGHGTFSPAGAKLNLIGPDLSAQELGQWLEPIGNPLVFVHGGSASSPFISSLSGNNRTIITATRSGTEQNYARFGEQFALSLRNDRSDIDLDGRVSILEAFLSASNAVETFYLEAGRLTSEHALIDDNGDAKGTPATQFQGLRPIDTSNLIDGRLARKLSLQPASSDRLLTTSQIQKRDRLEAELDALYIEKESTPPDEYYAELERILTELSTIYLQTETDS